MSITFSMFYFSAEFPYLTGRFEAVAGCPAGIQWKRQRGRSRKRHERSRNIASVGHSYDAAAVRHRVRVAPLLAVFAFWQVVRRVIRVALAMCVAIGLGVMRARECRWMLWRKVAANSGRMSLSAPLPKLSVGASAGSTTRLIASSIASAHPLDTPRSSRAIWRFQQALRDPVRRPLQRAEGERLLLVVVRVLRPPARRRRLRRDARQLVPVERRARLGLVCGHTEHDVEPLVSRQGHRARAPSAENVRGHSSASGYARTDVGASSVSISVVFGIIITSVVVASTVSYCVSTFKWMLWVGVHAFSIAILS